MKKFRTLYKEFKDKVVDNYEYWLLNHALEDIGEEGYVGIMDESDDFYYNVEISKDLAIIIENLLFSQNNKSKEEHDLMIDFLKLKRLTDKRILENKFYDQDYVDEYIFEINKNNERSKTTIKLNSKLKQPDVIIEEIYTFLSDKGYTNHNKKDFKSIFLENKDNDKIIWEGSLKEIAALIISLFNKNILPKKKERGKATKLIIDNFNYKKVGDDFNEKSLNKELSEVRNDETLCREIKDFFDQLNIKFD